jgi:rhomboid protease GluP
MWSVGASGAIFGVYGALMGHFLREKHAIPKSVFQPIMKSTRLFAGYNLFYGLVNPSIDNSAHIGGFVTGIVLGWVTAMPPDPALLARQWTGKMAQSLAATVLIVAVGVVEAPHFDHSPRDESALYRVTADIGAGETPLIERENQGLAQWEKTHANGAALGGLIDQELIHFYQQYANRTVTVVLSRGRATERKRQIVVQALQLKVAGFGT